MGFFGGGINSFCNSHKRGPLFFIFAKKTVFLRGELDRRYEKQVGIHVFWIFCYFSAKNGKMKKTEISKN